MEDDLRRPHLLALVRVLLHLLELLLPHHQLLVHLLQPLLVLLQLDGLRGAAVDRRTAAGGCAAGGGAGRRGHCIIELINLLYS